MPLTASTLAEDRAPRLAAGGVEFEYVRRSELGGTGAPGPLGFTLERGRVVLNPGAGRRPPEHAELEVGFDRGRDAEGTWRVAVDRYGGEGVPVLPGLRETFELDLPPASALRFATVSRSLKRSRGGLPGPLRFQVLLDGELLFEHEQARACLLYTSPSPRDGLLSRMPSSA